MEKSSQAGRGMWNDPRASPYSKETQQMLQCKTMLALPGAYYGILLYTRHTKQLCMRGPHRETHVYIYQFVFYIKQLKLNSLSLCTVMMQESRLNNFQQRQINQCLKSESLPNIDSTI